MLSKILKQYRRKNTERNTAHEEQGLMVSIRCNCLGYVLGFYHHPLFMSWQTTMYFFVVDKTTSTVQ